jgi:hypothetical protein
MSAYKVFGGVVVCVVAGGAYADTVKFEDKSSFLAAIGGTINTLEFENAAPNTAVYIGQSYTIDGITFKSNHMYNVDAEYYSGWFSQGTGDSLLAGYQNDGLASSDKSMTALLKAGTRAVGLDVTLEVGGSYVVTLADGSTISGVLPTSVYFDGTTYVRSHDFVGFTADSDITSINIDSTGGGWKIIDNFITATDLARPLAAVVPASETIVPVPLPAAAWGGMALLGGLGITRRLRRRGNDAVENE